jgi:hypothetical protein
MKPAEAPDYVGAMELTQSQLIAHDTRNHPLSIRERGR